MVTQASTGLSDAGVYGMVKSVITSTRHTARPDSLILHSNTMTDISSGTEFDINGRLAIGTGRFETATHPRITRSKFSTAAGSTVSHTGQDFARIGPGSVLHVEGDFSIGDTYINSHARIMCGEDITIGDGSAISWNFEILDDDRHQIIVDGDRPPQTGPVTIEDDVWIGHDVSIHKGVTVHEGSVVASDSVLLEDVPPNTLVAGSPAEVVREDVEWEW
ncbi:MAG: acyltransferase [Halodesulfurarchaeum sp.]